MSDSQLELQVLKGILGNKSDCIDFAFNCSPELFSPNRQTFAKLVVNYAKAYRNVPTRRTLLDLNSGSATLSDAINNVWDELDQFTYNLQELPYDLEQLKKHFQRKVLVDAQNRLTDDFIWNTDDPNNSLKELGLLVQKAHGVRQKRGHIQKPVADHLDEFQNRYDAMASVENPESVISLTHYSMLDAVTGGLAPGELVLIGGETNAGKSQLLLNMAVQMWAQENNFETPAADFKPGRSILYFSLEMPYDDCFNRFLARVAGVPERSIARGTLDEGQLARVRKAKKFIQEFQDAGYYFDIVDVPRNVSVNEIELRYNDALLRYKPDIVVVDYMGIMHEPSLEKEQDWLKMGGLAGMLHELSRDYGFIMLTAVQLTDIKRGSKGKDPSDNQRVGVHRIGRSSHIMHHANVGIQIESRPNEINYPDMRYHVIKNRKGPLGQGNLIKNFANATLIDVVNPNDAKTGEMSSDDIQGIAKQVRAKEDAS